MESHIEKLSHALLQFCKRTKSIDVLIIETEVRAQVAELPPDIVNALAVESLRMLAEWTISAMAEIDEPVRQRELVEQLIGRKLLSGEGCLERDFPEHVI